MVPLARSAAHFSICTLLGGLKDRAALSEGF